MAGRVPQWMRQVLVFAGAWHLILGGAMVIAPNAFFTFTKIAPLNYPQVWQGIGWQTREVDDRQRRAVHERWAQLIERAPGSPGYREEWYSAQCGGCVHWLALGGRLGDDWGVCSASKSPHDGVVRFEHDGCERFVEDPDGFGITRG